MQRTEAQGKEKETLLEEWVRQYAGAILKICFLNLGDYHLAQDAMQDIFMKAWRQINRYGSAMIRNEKAWLMKLAVNTSRDYRRSQWFKRMDFRESLEELPGEQTMIPENDRELVIEIGQLPDKYKQLVLLYYFQNMTLQDTADALGIPKSTASKRLKKAEEMLKQTIMGGEQA